MYQSILPLTLKLDPKSNQIFGFKLLTIFFYSHWTFIWTIFFMHWISESFIYNIKRDGSVSKDGQMFLVSQYPTIPSFLELIELFYCWEEKIIKLVVLGFHCGTLCIRRENVKSKIFIISEYILIYTWFKSYCSSQYLSVLCKYW